MLDLLCLASLALYGVSALPTQSLSSPRLVYQFPDYPPTFIENIATRGNGNLLFSTLSGPNIYTIDPTASKPTPKVAVTFPNVNCTSGIKEIGNSDVFAVITGNWSQEMMTGVYGSFSVWSVDFKMDPPVVVKIASIPDTTNLNGLAIIPALRNIIYLADGGNGALRILDSTTGKSRIALQHSMFIRSSNFPLGINGIESFGGNMYFTNSAKGIYGKIPLRIDGSVVGTVEQITSLELSQSYDDFAMDKHGNGLMAIKPSAVHRVTPSGETTVISGGLNSSDFAGPTSLVFGRSSPKEEATLYVTTAGLDMAHARLGGGQIEAVDYYQVDTEFTEPCRSFWDVGYAMSLVWKQRTLHF